MIKLLKKMFCTEVRFDRIIEGPLADEYSDPAIREEIKKRYIEKYTKKVTPCTDPLNFDPLNPPNGWKYDPYYEVWFEV